MHNKLSEHKLFFIQPLKMEPTEGSETSAALKLTPGEYPKEDIQKTHCL
jgi:hypothetical protein